MDLRQQLICVSDTPRLNLSHEICILYVQPGQGNQNMPRKMLNKL